MCCLATFEDWGWVDFANRHTSSVTNPQSLTCVWKVFLPLFPALRIVSGLNLETVSRHHYATEKSELNPFLHNMQRTCEYVALAFIKCIWFSLLVCAHWVFVQLFWNSCAAVVLVRERLLIQTTSVERFLVTATNRFVYSHHQHCHLRKFMDSIEVTVTCNIDSYSFLSRPFS